MTVKERLKLMKEVEERNRKRIKAFVEKPRKRRLHGFSDKTDEYRADSNKRK